MTPQAEHAELARLRAELDVLDEFWRHESMASSALLSWMIQSWSPWYHGWKEFDVSGGSLDERGDVRPGLLADLSAAVERFREQAGARGFPVPGFSSPGHADVDLWDELRNLWQRGQARAASLMHTRSAGEAMYPLIGKKGGGGGGGGGHHHGRGGRGRQFFGGGWSYYPEPYYAYPPWPWPYAYSYPYAYASQEQEDVISGRGMRGGGGSGIGMRRGMRRMRRQNQNQWQQQPQQQDDGGGEPLMYVPQNGDPNEEPIAVSGDNELFILLPVLTAAGARYDQEASIVTAGWLDGLKRAALFAASPVVAVHKEFSGTLKKYKGPIQTAATAVATAYGGPAGGAAASQLVGPMIDSLHDGSTDQLLSAIQQQAGNDPTVAQAVDDAQKAVAHTTAAYHLAQTATKAADGDEASSRKVAEVDDAASRGDFAAIQAMQIMTEVLQRVFQNQVRSETRTGAVPQKKTRAAAERKRLRSTASELAKDARAETGYKVIGVVLDSSGHQATSQSGRQITHTETALVQFFDDLDHADAWLGRVLMMEPPTYTYVAYYDASDPTWPHPVNESFAPNFERPRTITTTSGLPILPFLLGGAAGFGVDRWLLSREVRGALENMIQHPESATIMQAPAPHPALPAAPPPVPPPAPPTVSGAGPLLPALLAFGAGGAAGWWGHDWWHERQAAQANGAAGHAQPPATASGWW